MISRCKHVILVAIVFLAAGCVPTVHSFAYNPSGEMVTTDNDSSEKGRTITASATGAFVGSDCASVNAKAIGRITRQLAEGERLTGLQWLDQGTGEFVSRPLCKETVFTFHVTVRGVVVGAKRTQ